MTHNRPFERTLTTSALLTVPVGRGRLDRLSKGNVLGNGIGSLLVVLGFLAGACRALA
jgi:hypothetical protein